MILTYHCGQVLPQIVGEFTNPFPLQMHWATRIRSSSVTSRPFPSVDTLGDTATVCRYGEQKLQSRLCKQASCDLSLHSVF